ncbi:helix-turn-helix domain-containing protein [Metapseudomonas furukawaii]|jgi:HTH-type transcriptional regulator/antitoxin HigA|uniref:Cytoplasmic protein n=1 Tax=Metapseudomonas furukawaii TaxID=1149133 RepID=A0AAD1C491_METFU|nr:MULTISPECIES: transcriptional regulator [Pseudomonas]ELS29407.1 Putative transcription regulator [Pseudomonas furukawaii]OWJ92576.1 transcriptional regulator [Pseudomonas sp. A46]WAG77644.1 transcriptional regulator [Pseudomonas furukawaii]BAU75742.1 putative cytoplasmic protein [Pseudomonas furukawaii]
MDDRLKLAKAHWHFVAPLLTPPRSEADYRTLVDALDELLDEIAGAPEHPLGGLAAQMGELIAAYDAVHFPMPKAPGREVLRLLMQEHGLSQGDLPEVGAQSVVSEILAGKRQLNVRQIRALVERFQVPADLFI